MKKLIAIVLFFAASSAYAACPPYTVYGCTPMPNGKMSCGCR